MIDELLGNLDKARKDIKEPDEANGIVWIVGGVLAMAIGSYIVSKSRETPKESADP